MLENWNVLVSSSITSLISMQIWIRREVGLISENKMLIDSFQFYAWNTKKLEKIPYSCKNFVENTQISTKNEK